ncbi:hypothetical protein VFPPC_18720 [Pochonia chlamydosporia 170]|uniref:Uncharacterized protein n=1 Tax=Pochonia chlamydosporia 170 TaxID=1380566 RepID=A0A219ARZ0_METCM|nr:hypothetical protein VFPPC_18720 [Pochonia chlamydosporia 170]OWT43553.1 hypothetical protein VFPPC_18720 [Pochonia chlamydosporia 170]
MFGMERDGVYQGRDRLVAPPGFGFAQKVTPSKAISHFTLFDDVAICPAHSLLIRLSTSMSMSKLDSSLANNALLYQVSQSS